MLIFVGASTVDWGYSVVVREADGRTMVRAALPDSGRFRVEYMHSYYKVPAVEHFVAEEYGSFELVEVSSSSEAVLDYYELEGHKETGDDLLRLVLDEPQRFEALPLIGTEKGRRTLDVSNERLPLYAEGRPQHLVIRVEEDTLFTEMRGLLYG
jgi:hypothetical protein